MENIDQRWQKSSYSGNGGGDCVEVGPRPQVMLVRDTKDRRGPVLRFKPHAWRKFTDSIKT
jgi:hypothetical protein